MFARRLLTVALVVALVGVPVAVGAPQVAAQSEPASVAISNVTVSTQMPSVGEPFSLRVTISNYEGSPHMAAINELVVDAEGE